MGTAMAKPVLPMLGSRSSRITGRDTAADFVREFARDIDHELAEVGSWWWNQETQAALHRMVEQLAVRKKS
jgi:hypothetical protein